MSDPQHPPSQTATLGLVPSDSATTQAPPSSAASTEEPRSIPGYELMEQLGRGGMGVVYKARQTQLNRIVALKMIICGTQSDDDSRARFQREAEAVAQLTHPHIVQIHEVGTWRTPEGDLLPFFSMEYCSGGSLGEYLDGTPLTPKRAAALVEMLARAVHVAHVKHLVHRDLKPANIMLVADEADSSAVSLEKEAVEQNTLLSALAEARLAVARRQGGSGTPPVSDTRKKPSTSQTATPGQRWLPKITDFGLARRQDDDSGLTATGAIVGTPSYMAPEQARAEKDIGPGCDIYALGAILYECLTGRPPFRAATAFETVMQVVHDDPVPPRQLNPRVPRDLETIALRCLRKLPNQRYTSAADLAADLRRFLDGEPITARPAGIIERGVRWARRRPTAAALVAVSLLALLLLAGGGAWFTWEMDISRRNAQRLAADRADALREVEKERDRAEEALRQAVKEKRLADEQRQEANRQLARAEVSGYSLQIAFARKALDEWNITQANELLSKCKPELRGWAHRALSAEMSRRVSPLLLPGVKEIETAVIQPQGEEIACSVGDRVLIVSLPSRKVSRTLQAKPGGKPITQLAYSQDGKLLAGSMDDRVLVWKPVMNREVHSLTHGGKPVACFFVSADASRLASAAGGFVHIWDLKNGKKLHSWPLSVGKDALAVALTADNKQVVALLPGTLPPGKPKPTHRLVLDVETGKTVAEFASGDQSWVGMAADLGGILFATGSLSGPIRVTGPEIRPSVYVGHTAPVEKLAFGPNLGVVGVVAPLLVTASKHSHDKAGSIRVWEARSGRPVAVLRRPSAPIDSLSVDRNGMLAVGNDAGEVHLWDLKTHPESVRINGLVGNKDWFAEALAFSPSGDLLTSRVKSTVQVWHVNPPKMVYHVRAAEYSRPVFDPQGRYLAFVAANPDSTVTLCDARTGKKLHDLISHKNSVTALAFTADGQTLATADDSSILLWDMTTRLPTTLWKGENKHDAHALAFSPDGKRLACNRSDGSVTIFDRDSGKVLHRLSGEWGPSHGLAFSPDGQTLAVGGFGPEQKVQDVPRPGSLRLWDVTTGKQIQSLPVPPSEVINVAFSPDGRQLFSASAEGTVRIWDVKTGLQVHSLRCTGAQMSAAAFSADGQRIALVGTDKIIHVHDAPAAAKK